MREKQVSTGRVIYAGRKFRLEQRLIAGSDGQARTVDLIYHPGAAVILPLLADGRVLLERVYRYSVEAELLELPAGTLEPPEPPAACAARELTEETGYVAGRIVPLCAFYSSPGVSTEQMHVFVATELVAGPHAREPDERITLVPLTWAEVWAAVRDGTICDAKTLTTLLYYQMLGREV
jgi:ADP-ribose pyrophosphatase